MPRLMMTLVALGLVLAMPAQADGSRTVKFEIIAAKRGDTSCTLSASGGAQTFSPPARIAVAVGGDGAAQIGGLTCRSGGVTRKLGRIPGSNTAVVVIDFSDSGTEFWFERSDGGAVGRMSGGRFVGG